MRDVPAQIVGARLERLRAVEDVDQPPGGLGGERTVAALRCSARKAWGPRVQQEARGRPQGSMSPVPAGTLFATPWSERRIISDSKGFVRREVRREGIEPPTR